MQKSVFLVKANAEQHDNGTNSERMFQDFLRAHSFDFIREFVVGSGENPNPDKPEPNRDILAF
jgi:hypothetical protein